MQRRQNPSCFRKNFWGAGRSSVTGSCRFIQGPLEVSPVDIPAETKPSESSRLHGQGARKFPNDGRVSPVDRSENPVAPILQTTVPPDLRTDRTRTFPLGRAATQKLPDDGRVLLGEFQTTEESRLWTFRKTQSLRISRQKTNRPAG